MLKDVRRDAVLFDVYSTLIDIWTNEVDVKVWEGLASFLSYRDLLADPSDLRDNYFGLAEQSQRDSSEQYPEVNVLALFERLLRQLRCPEARSLAADVTRLFRTLSMVHFDVFPDVFPTLRRLREHFRLGVVSDAQPIFFRPELARAGLAPFMDAVVTSGEYGFRKPDPRLFQTALARLGLPPGRATHVGDSIDLDMCGAKAAQVRAVLIDRRGELGHYVGRCQPDRTIGSLDELYDWLMSKR